jgi:sentrin-specific protease 8
LQTTDLKGDVAALPDFRKVTHIFLPISDSRDRLNADSGSHWSLLLVSVIDRIAFHYDSLGGSNYWAAKKGVDRLSWVLGVPLKFHQLDDCPQQANSKDCGVFVCILMRHLLIKRLLNANSNEKVSMSMAGKVVDTYGGRKEMLKIIESLRKEGERRRSASPFTTSSDEPPRID